MDISLLLLDNYDSFTYNLYHYLEPMVTRIDVLRNDVIDMDSLGSYDAIVFSPGPGLPAEAGQMPEIIARYAEQVPMLGVCLGHQALGEYFGARLLNMPTALHGQPSECLVNVRQPLFENCDEPLIIGHYHSWAVDKVGLPECLEILATHEQGYIMAMRHRSLPLYGVQFHPESILTPDGKKILRNWLNTLH